MKERVREREKGPVRVLTTNRCSGGSFWRRGSDGTAVRRWAPSSATMAARELRFREGMAAAARLDGFTGCGRRLL